jgi:ABC-2 type transport system ATP-binding protein
MQPVIKLDHVTKMYGISRGVTDISLDIEPGTVFGFLGPNGAGKTTTISMLVDLTRPTNGHISIFGLDSQRDSVAIRRRIGFLAGDFALDNELTGWQQLEYFGNLRGSFDRAYVRELSERLNCDLDKRFKTLSRGNRQKIGLISALMHKPELLIFDEPTSGLDPLVQAEFNTIIAEHQRAGKTAFISSHTLSEVEVLCTQLAFIREGELVAVRSIDEISSAATKHIRISTSDKKLIPALSKLKGVTMQTHETTSASFTLAGDINPLLSLLAKHQLQDVTIQEADLESIFMQYYQEGSHV